MARFNKYRNYLVISVFCVILAGCNNYSPPLTLSNELMNCDMGYCVCERGRHMGKRILLDRQYMTLEHIIEVCGL